jgi:2-polyprenyl-6-methoxyphenol hydroxylase-like FAD-dependent oxidoreductase
MVVGCDGIKSAVKEYIQTGKIQKDAAKRQAAVYSGIRIRYAVQDGNDSTRGQDTSELRQYFGEGAYALTGTYGAGAGRPPAKSAFIISLDKDYVGPFKKPERRASEKVNENADWTQDVRTPASSREVMLQQVKDCRIPAVDAVPTIESADRFFELGVYFHNPFSLSGWSKQVPGTNAYCTLSGDAAHAMPPFLGQGSNQAIQDAYSLAKKIYEHNARSLGTFEEPAVGLTKDEETEVNLKTLLREYEQVRWATTTSISAKAGFLGYLEASEGFPAKFRDVFFSTMFKTGIARNIFLGAAIPKV